MRAHRSLIAALLGIVLLSAPAYAQNAKAWSEPYKSGQDAIKAGKYQEAAQFFETAIKANGKAEAHKRTEGVFSTDYFPYYYLGIAYYELHQYDKAKDNLDKAANPQPTDKNDIAKLKDYTAKTLVALNNNAPKSPVGPTVNAAFVNALQNGEGALQAKRWQDAIAAFDTARSADSTAYSAQQVQAKRDQATHDWASELNIEGNKLLPTSLSQAKTQFQHADQLVPGSAADGLTQVKQREDAYQTAKAGVEPDITAKNFKAAKDKLDRARQANPEQFNTDRLEARLNIVNTGLNTNIPSAPIGNTIGTPGLPGGGLKDAGLDKNAKAPPVDTTKDSLRTALLELVKGDTQNSISILQPLSQQQPAGAANAAALHAYLGVAYATQALSSAKSDEQAHLSDSAREQFKLALASQPAFKLSPSLVSPKILQMFEQARR